MISIHEIKNHLENNKAIKNPAFITKIIDKIKEDHKYKEWKEELNCLAFLIDSSEEHISVIVSSRFITYSFTNSVKNPEYIHMLCIGNIELQYMYDVCRYREIQK